MSLPATDPATLTLRRCNNRKFSVDRLLMADMLARQVLYPYPAPDPLDRARDHAARGVLSVLSSAQLHAARCEFMYRARSLGLRELPEYVERFVVELLGHVHELELLSAVACQMLRYAVLEHADSGLRVEQEQAHPAGFAVYTTQARYVGDRLRSASAHISPHPGDRAPAGTWVDRRPSRYNRAWLLGPIRFALFVCVPPSKCCLPNCAIVSEPGHQPNGASLIVVRDIPPGGHLVVGWAEEFLGPSRSQLGCTYMS